jgi:predicted transcriptional regulator
VLWHIGEASVQQVKDELSKHQRVLAYTTVLTVLDRLERRRAVQRRKEGRAFVYAPVLELEKARRTAVRELVDTYFHGSVDRLREYLNSLPIEQPRTTSDLSSGDSILDPTLL